MALEKGVRAEIFDSSQPTHIEKVAEMIMDGRIVAFPFNGVFGIFGNIRSHHAVNDILGAKQRPEDKKLVATYLPEHIEEIADISTLCFPKDSLVELWRNIHALGVIFHAADEAPFYLVNQTSEKTTILSIWTEYFPLRQLSEELRRIGGKGLVGTSANKSGQPTHWKFEELEADFRYDVHAMVRDEFSLLPKDRRKSTSIIDCTQLVARLHREGNVSEGEIRSALTTHGIGELSVGRDVISVRPRR